MPRVLIADDNSNIQKMVSLALKDAGIEVVGVNNGEAAVRKMPEISPDLVLADIFMPVRSGYEVCEFVKNDPRFMHVPVILLAGAFDPFDEREAQRVRADGVLKKPFVPPDPLLSMVTSLLTKATERLVAVGVSASRVTEAQAARHEVPVREAPVEHFADEQPEELEVPRESLSFADDKTLAFASLLESPAAPPETDSVLTAMRDPVLGTPSFWQQTQANEVPPVEELPEEESWDAPVSAHHDAGHIDAAEMDLAPEIPAMEYVAEEFEAQTAESPAPPATESVETFDWPGAAAESASVIEARATEDLEPVGAQEVPAERSAGEVLFRWPTLPAEETTFAAKPEAEAVAMDFSAATEAAAPATNGLPAVEPVATNAVEPAAETAPTEQGSPSTPLSHVPELEEFAGVSHLAETAEAALASSPELASVFEPAAIAAIDLPHHEAREPLDPEMIEAVVARVVDRMQPRMIEIVTREILRPVVEALVRRELEKK